MNAGVFSQVLEEMEKYGRKTTGDMRMGDPYSIFTVASCDFDRHIRCHNTITHTVYHIPWKMCIFHMFFVIVSYIPRHLASWF